MDPRGGLIRSGGLNQSPVQNFKRIYLIQEKDTLKKYSLKILLWEMQTSNIHLKYTLLILGGLIQWPVQNFELCHAWEHTPFLKYTLLPVLLKRKHTGCKICNHCDQSLNFREQIWAAKLIVIEAVPFGVLQREGIALVGLPQIRNPSSLLTLRYQPLYCDTLHSKWLQWFVLGWAPLIYDLYLLFLI